MMNQRWFLALVAFSLLAPSSACVATRTSGSDCIVQSECNDPLVCSAGFCRAPCSSDGDCSMGNRCAYARDVRRNVCFNPAGSRTCGANPCGTGTSCADGLCVSTCAAGCPSGTTCSTNSTHCVLATAADAGTDGSLQDAMVDDATDSAADAQPEASVDVMTGSDSSPDSADTSMRVDGVSGG